MSNIGMLIFGTEDCRQVKLCENWKITEKRMFIWKKKFL